MIVAYQKTQENNLQLNRIPLISPRVSVSSILKDLKEETSLTRTTYPGSDLETLIMNGIHTLNTLTENTADI